MKQAKITLEDLFNLPSAVIYNPDGYTPVRFVSMDSRTIKKGSLFVAIKGESLDGHKYVTDAVKNGASAIVVNKNSLKQFDNIDLPIVAVDDTTIAYGQLANIWRHKINAKVVAITGSNGKTTTKEMTAAVLSARYKVVKTKANNNNHIGVPLTLFEADEKTEVIVLEQGTNHFKEIEYSAKISEPDVALITNIGDSHLEFLKDREGVYKEKSALLDITDSCNGTVLINNDDPYLRKGKKSYKNVVTYGFKGKVDIKGKILEYSDTGLPVIEIEGKGKKLKTKMPVYGEANACDYLAAVVTALELGLKKSEIVEGTKNIKAVKGRMNAVEVKNTLLIDDTYNSNPASVKAGLDVLKKAKKYKRRIAVLGDMLELGCTEGQLHSQLSESVVKSKVDEIYTIGKRMKNLYESLPDGKINKRHFATRNSLKKFLGKLDIDNTIILIKGSRGMKMEDYVEVLKSRLG